MREGGIDQKANEKAGKGEGEGDACVYTVAVVLSCKQLIIG